MHKVLCILALFAIVHATYITKMISTGTGLKCGNQGSSFKPGDDTTLYVGSIFNGTISRVNAVTGDFLGVYVDSNQGSADDNAWTPDGKYIVWTSLLDGVVRSWDGVGAIKVVASNLVFPNAVACYYNNTVAAGKYNIRCVISTYPVNSGLYVVDPSGATPAFQIVDTVQLPYAVNAFAFGPDSFLYAPGAATGNVAKINIFSKPPTVQTILTGFVDLESCRWTKGNKTLLCLDSAVNTIYSLDPTNNFFRTVYANIRNKTYIDNFIIGSDNSLYLSDSASNSIVKVFPNKYSRSIIYSPLGLPSGLSYLYEGGVSKIYLADYYSLRLFQSQTRNVETFSRSNTIIAVNDEYGYDLSFGIENIYVTNDLMILVIPLNSGFPGAVQVRDRKTLAPLYDLSGVSGHPYGIAYLSDKSFVVADYPLGLVRYTPAAGVGYTSATYYSSVTQNAVGLAADPTQSSILYFSNWDSGIIYKYNINTNVATRVLRNLIRPEGVAISTDGKTLFIAEEGRDRIVSIPVTASNVDASSIIALILAGGQVVASNIPFGIAYASPGNAPPNFMSSVTADQFDNVYFTVDSTNSLGVAYSLLGALSGGYEPASADAASEDVESQYSLSSQQQEAPSQGAYTTLLATTIVLGVLLVAVTIGMLLYVKKLRAEISNGRMP